MQVKFKGEGTSGKVIIPPGEYWVSLNGSGGEILLAGGGKTYRIQGTQRRTQAKCRSTTVVFQSGGAKVWSLIISTPKYGEWIALIDVKEDKKS
jgi:hypothetical protein